MGAFKPIVILFLGNHHSSQWQEIVKNIAKFKALGLGVAIKRVFLICI